MLRPVAAAAFVTGRHRTLIHQWARDGLVTSACDVRTRDLLVDLAEVAEVSGRKPRRAPRVLTVTQR
jgi:hypothetical protein